jgi:hypothetical protein
MHNFTRLVKCSYILFLRVEVVKIQISLQIIKIFEKEKEFLIPHWAVGQNSAESQARPGQPLLFPPPFSTPTQPTEWPSQPTHRFQPDIEFIPKRIHPLSI